MMFSRDLRDAVARGEVTVSIRLWARPQVKVGGRYRTAAVTWPGPVPYLALSSGTTTGTTKYLPISPEMLVSNRRAALTACVRVPHQTKPRAHLQKVRNCTTTTRSLLGLRDWLLRSPS